MSWHYLQDLEEEFSLQNYLDGIPSAQWRSTNTVGKCYFKDKETRSCQGFLSGMTLEHSMENHGEEKSTLSQEDSHVKTSAKQTKNKKDLMEDIQVFGLSLRESLEKLGLHTFSSKMFQICGIKDSDKSCSSLPTWGIMLDGEFSELLILKHRIKESECGLWLPTPTEHIYKEGGYPAEYRRKSLGLGAVAGGPLNPEWVEWIMGWPIGWTDLNPLGMDKYQSWLRSWQTF